MRSVALGVCAVAALFWSTGPGARAAADSGRSVRSAGCGKRAGTGKLKLSTLDGRKSTRTYLLEVPTDYDPSRMQDHLFIAPSLPFLRRELEALVRRYGIPVL